MNLTEDRCVTLRFDHNSFAGIIRVSPEVASYVSSIYVNPFNINV